MHVIVWEFQIRAKTRKAFLRAYGSKGAWARLFRKAPGYICTQLLQDPGNPARFFTVDIWRTQSAFQKAKKKFHEEYATLDGACERLTRAEKRIGSFDF